MATLGARNTNGAAKVRSVERALRIMLAFSPEEPELSLSEVSRRLKLSVSTTHRLLRTLQAYGFVGHQEDRSEYRLGLTLFKLGSIVQHSMTLHRQADSALRRLSRRTQETAYLCNVDNDQALCLDRVDGEHQVRVLALDVGGRLPLNCGGAPRALLASLSDEEIHRLIRQNRFVRLRPKSLVRPAEIWEDVKRTRKQGYVFCAEDVIESVGAIGAPIRDHSGQVVGALSIAGILPHFEGELRAAKIQAVVEEARVVSEGLGWTDSLLPHPGKDGHRP